MTELRTTGFARSCAPLPERRRSAPRRLAVCALALCSVALCFAGSSLAAQSTQDPTPEPPKMRNRHLHFDNHASPEQIKGDRALHEASLRALGWLRCIADHPSTTLLERIQLHHKILVLEIALKEGRVRLDNISTPALTQPDLTDNPLRMGGLDEKNTWTPSIYGGSNVISIARKDFGCRQDPNDPNRTEVWFLGGSGAVGEALLAAVLAHEATHFDDCYVQCVTAAGVTMTPADCEKFIEEEIKGRDCERFVLNRLELCLDATWLPEWRRHLRERIEHRRVVLNKSPINCTGHR